MYSRHLGQVELESLNSGEHIPPKGAEKRYYVLTKGPEFLFCHLPLNLLVSSQCSKQRHPCSALSDREVNKLDLMGRKVCSAGLQFCISNYLALVTQYDFISYGWLAEFTDKLLPQNCSQFQAALKEGQLLSRSMLQVALDSADRASYVLAMGILCKEGLLGKEEIWLHSSGFPREVQNTTEELPFDELHLFNQKMEGESVHSLKDSRVTLRSLNIYTLAPKRKFYHPVQSLCHRASQLYTNVPTSLLKSGLRFIDLHLPTSTAQSSTLHTQP